MKPIAEKLSRSLQSVSEHWNYKIKPTLLAYHSGRLHKQWRLKFLKYLVKKRIKSSQEADWAEAKVLFPDQNRMTMSDVMLSAVNRSKGLPFYKVIRNRLHGLKQRDQFNSERSRKYREDIIREYNKVRGVQT
jgi:hypothetical protein